MMVWSANLGMLYGELPLPDRPAAAAAAGFGTIECWWPPDREREELVERIRALPVDVACVNAGCASVDSGGPCLNDPNHRDTAQRDFEAALELAAAVGASAVSLPVGHAVAQRSLRAQLADAAATLGELAGEAAAAGVTVLIEPLNPGDAPGYLIADADAAAGLLDAVGADSVQLLFDAYHAAECGEDPSAVARRHGDLIGHVQYADSPGRGHPGSGRSDLWRLVETLDEVGYDGAVGLEFLGDTAAGLAFLERGPAGAAIHHGRRGAVR